jgi:hypothetical protein
LNGYDLQHNAKFNFFGGYWVKLSDISKMPTIDYSTVIWPTPIEIEKMRKGLFGFSVQSEYQAEVELRNRAQQASPEFLKSLKDLEEWREKSETVMKYTKPRVMIPAGALLKVDRIYIRKGNEKYSSVSFFWKNNPTNKKLRFFAKLKHCNEMECEIIV